MPWTVLAAVTDSNTEAARRCLQPLMPLIGRVLEHMLKRLRATSPGDKVREGP